MSQNISAKLYFQDSNSNTYYFKIKNYKGYVYDTKTNTIRLMIDNKLCLFRDVKLDTIKATTIKN